MILAVAIAAGVVFFILRKKRRANNPYLPSSSEKKRNKEDKFVYDPEDTSYLNTPYREMDGTSSGKGQRYEMQGSEAGNSGVGMYGNVRQSGGWKPQSGRSELSGQPAAVESDMIGVAVSGHGHGQRAPFEKD